ncbi:NrfD/PsrC family molybdoenzyme membrane anchor subunit [Haliangium ochraceum]|uniref:Polysulphide reductase NrfD n=1 Tax=Haliangium ochraceum (strain DSM 14365 / JCM 11303 / SMP-2) TaxID=502025 RepID=D0LN64_HALO1|nr:NrfD/PsrC family molybdoenzyme membrane anchor subunit [Haliangium ochraceum]ACY15241.1 Polysulphide reductase NrfD [Haliangium ochraceum DSM 14365]
MSAPVLIGRPSDAELSDQLLGTTWRPGGRLWRLAFAACAAGTLGLFALIAYVVSCGIGLWGNNIPVAWGFGIINFVWWIGIGHAGTFISAILLLFEQRWRTSINRFAEAMTLFAVVQAALFPLLHLGRPWFGYWLFPYPSTMDVWPQVKSALPWDAAAITTYGLVSLLFWYLGLLPDLAGLRDRSPTRARRLIYGVLALGWRGNLRTWRHYRAAYLVLAGLATPLVISVHSIVSSDFAIGATPGWHSTVFPPFFVAGAIFSGFAMVLTLLIPVRAVFGLHRVITERHLDACAKMLLVTGWIVIYGYAVEFFTAWYSGSEAEIFQFFAARPSGPNAAAFWLMLACNVLVPQLFWSRRMRRDVRVLMVAALLINVGMWCERFVIVVMSLQREFLTAAWGSFSPTWVDIGILGGTMCFFGLLLLSFVRVLPMVSAAEVKELAHELAEEAEQEQDDENGDESGDDEDKRSEEREHA